MKKFEYYLVEVTDHSFNPIDPDALTEELDALGREGWEVVAITDRGGQWRWWRRAHLMLITLKREVGG